MNTNIVKGTAAVVLLGVMVLFNPLLPVTLVSWRFLWAYLASATTLGILLAMLRFQLRPRLSMPSITDRTPGSQSL